MFGRPTIRDVNGTALSAGAVANPYLFTGRRYDAEAGLYYYRARYYDFATARFLQPDPLGYVDGLNMYAYVGNSPLSYVDPLGLYIGVNGTDAELELFREARAYLGRSDRFNDTYNKLDDDTSVSYRITIVSDVESQEGLNPITGEYEILWNPHQAQMNLDGSSMSPAMVLAHELEHIRNRWEGDHAGDQSFDNKEDVFRWKNVEEYNVITDPERQIANELGEPSRDSHRCVGFYDSMGPTITWPADFVKYGQLVEELARINGWVGKKPTR